MFETGMVFAGAQRLLAILLLVLGVGCGGEKEACTPTSCDVGLVCSPSGECVAPLDGSTLDAAVDGDAAVLDAGQTDGAPLDANGDSGAPAGDATSLRSAEMLSPTTIELVFDGIVEGSNLGFTLFGTRSTGFTALSGFGTTTLTATIAEDVVYGEVVTVTYDEVTGDLRGVRWFRKELVTNELPYVGGAAGTGRDIFVSASATNGDGTADNPYAVSQLAGGAVQVGDRVNIRAGLYSGALPVDGNGTPGNPIVYEGYDELPGDTRFVTHPEAWATFDEDPMPLFVGASRASSIFINLTGGKHHLSFRNLQARNYRNGVRAVYSVAAHDLYFANISLADMGTDDTNGAGFNLTYRADLTGPDAIRAIHVINSYCANASTHNFWVDGDDSYMYNNRSYSNDNRSHAWDTDYMFTAYYGHRIVWRRLYAEKGPDPAHAGHGLTFKGESADHPIEDSLIDDCETRNINGAIEFRHSHVRNNLARNVRIDGTGGGSGSGGIVFRDGASFNTADSCYASDLEASYIGFVTFLDTSEDGGYGQLMEGNVVSNSVFARTRGPAIQLGTSDDNDVLIRDNQLLNNTFVGAPNLLEQSLAATVSNLVLTNNVFVDIAALSYLGRGVDTVPTYNNYFNFWGENGTPPAGVGNVSVDPRFVDPSSDDYRLAADSPIADSGSDLPQVPYDANGTQRMPGLYSMGAFETD